MDEIRIGVAGLGHRGLHWIRLLQKVPGYRITAIYDWIEPLQERALAEIASRDDVKVFGNYYDFLAYEGMDAVGLVVRQMEQGTMAAEALEAGKHVNCEVPAAHTMEECWRIVTNVERTGLVYSLAEQTRFWGFVDGWKKLVDDGMLGKITYAEGQYLGYYGTHQWFQDFKTGKQYPVEALPDHPGAEPANPQYLPYIISASYDLSILLKILEDRVTEVTAMSTKPPSYTTPEMLNADMQAALMKTEKDTLIRMLNGFNQPRPHGDHHWWQLIGTKGSVEWRRSGKEKPKLWLADTQMNDWMEVDWQYRRTDAPAEARGSGHGDADYYVHMYFRDAILKGEALAYDVYRVMDSMAPAVLAVDSIEEGGRVVRVPDFRPCADRPSGQMPADLGGIGGRIHVTKMPGRP